MKHEDNFYLAYKICWLIKIKTKKCKSYNENGKIHLNFLEKFGRKFEILKIKKKESKNRVNCLYLIQ